MIRRILGGLLNLFRTGVKKDGTDANRNAILLIGAW